MKFEVVAIPELRMAMSAMAKKDVRYYLNGVLFDLKSFQDTDSMVENVPLVATNGHVIIDSPINLTNRSAIWKRFDSFR